MKSPGPGESASDNPPKARRENKITKPTASLPFTVAALRENAANFIKRKNPSRFAGCRKSPRLSGGELILWLYRRIDAQHPAKATKRQVIQTGTVQFSRSGRTSNIQ
jgi:hypothetical protein